MSDLPIEVQRAVIERQIRAWKELLLDNHIAHKVHSQLGAKEDRLAVLVDEMHRAEKALLILEQELSALASMPAGAT